MTETECNIYKGVQSWDLKTSRKKRSLEEEDSYEETLENGLDRDNELDLFLTSENDDLNSAGDLTNDDYVNGIMEAVEYITSGVNDIAEKITYTLDNTVDQQSGIGEDLFEQLGSSEKETSEQNNNKEWGSMSPDGGQYVDGMSDDFEEGISAGGDFFSDAEMTKIGKSGSNGKFGMSAEGFGEGMSEGSRSEERRVGKECRIG